MQNGLNTKAMLVDLSIRCWNAHRHDKKVSREVAESHGTSESVGRYNKNLLPFDAPSYTEIRRAIVDLRMEHYKQTLPWSNEGARILAADNYMRYTESYRVKKARVDKGVAAFIPEYPALKEQARRVMKSLYREEDYPRVADIQRLFDVSLRVFPLPTGDDFRISLTDTSEIREQIDRDTRAAIAESMKDCYRRLHVVVSHMAEKLADPKGKFKNSLVNNIIELVDILPSFNITSDPDIDRMTDVVKRKLAVYDPEDLRKNKRLRRSVADEAKRIEADLAAFMGVQG